MGRPAKDLTGQIFGYLTVLSRAGSAADGHATWLCKCECGNETIVSSTSLQRAKNGTKSCGCYAREAARQKGINSYHDLTGQRFGLLTAKEYLGSNGKESVLWRCECDCGEINFITTSHHLVSGNTQSCSCLKSKGERNIKIVLIQNNISYIVQYSFPDLFFESKIPVRFDFYLPDCNRLIEFDGSQHFYASGGWSTPENLARNQKYDALRNEYALSHNIPLVRIPYWKRDKITLEMLLGDEYLVKQ